MKTFQYVCMVIGFLFSGLSAMMFWGDGVYAWIWQVIVMIWIIDAFFKQRTIDKMENEINNLKNKK